MQAMNRKLGWVMAFKSPVASIRTSAALVWVLSIPRSKRTMFSKDFRITVTVARWPVHRCSSYLFNFSPLYTAATVGFLKYL